MKWCYAYWQEILIALFLWELAPWNLENIRKSTTNLSFLCQFFINEITASDAGPDIIRSHLFINEITSSDAGPDIIRYHLFKKL